MRSKFVLRLLNADGHMLGWQELYALARGDGGMWAEGETIIPIDAPGLVTVLSIHWADVNIEVRQPVDPPQVVTPGSFITVPAGNLMQVAPMATGLPPVTTRQNATIGVPVGTLAAFGHA